MLSVTDLPSSSNLLYYTFSLAAVGVVADSRLNRVLHSIYQLVANVCDHRRCDLFLVACRIKIDFGLISWGFGKFSLVISIWMCMKTATISLYSAFNLWNYLRPSNKSTLSKACRRISLSPSLLEAAIEGLTSGQRKCQLIFVINFCFVCCTPQICMYCAHCYYYVNTVNL